MINSVTIYNDIGESITMELRRPELSGFLVRYIDGLGPTKANIELTEMALMDGAFFNSARSISRNIVFYLTFMEEGIEYIPDPPEFMFEIEDYPEFEKQKEETLEKILEDPPELQGLMLEDSSPLTNPIIEDTRHKAYKYFPLRKRIRIVIETDRRTCETYGYVETNDPVIFSSKAGAQISVRCPSSFLFSTEVTTTIFDSIESLFEFPFSNESLTVKLIEFSLVHEDPIKNIIYEGDAEIGIIIHIHAIGDITNIAIARMDSSGSLEIDTDRLILLTGEGLHYGDDVIISTVKGNKYAKLIRDGVETNILNCLNRYPEWFQLRKGDNLFTYTAETGVTNVQLRIENQTAYEGV